MEAKYWTNEKGAGFTNITAINPEGDMNVCITF